LHFRHSAAEYLWAQLGMMLPEYWEHAVLDGQFAALAKLVEQVLLQL